MKLAVICGSSRYELLPGLREMLDPLFIEYKTWLSFSKMDECDMLTALENCLEFSEYVLCIPEIPDFKSHWLCYLLGYQRGLRDRLSFWINDGVELPGWFRERVMIFEHEQELYRHYSELEHLWRDSSGKKLACDELRKRNIEISNRSFIECIRSGDRFLMGLFLDAGFSPLLKDPKGVPVLNHAIRSSNDALVEPLLAAGADMNSRAGDRNSTPVMDAAAAGLEELVGMLVKKGVELDHVSLAGQTAVTLAVGNGHDRAALYLINGGADVDITDNMEMSARSYAKLYNKPELLKVMDSFKNMQ